ncbi:MAG: VOC family protein [Bacteroidetes bacterium]|nr:VOC family protein [Bacteroidota bacterium]
MDSTSNALNWFEIAVNDMDRAKAFYQTVFGIEMSQEEMMGMQMAYFPGDMMNGKVAGALVKSDYHKPSVDGSVIYLNGNPDLAHALGRVEAAGGQVVMPKTAISPEVGFMAFFIDSEGNRVAMHSNH